jgi:hypothetical protein
MASIAEFKREYTRAVAEGYAAVFAGAGLTRPSGFADWKGLVRPFADELGLDIEKEKSDLIAVTQFYVNEKRNRAAVNQRIINEFTRGAMVNENIKILTRLPIATYWTTNYDKLIEQGLAENHRKADVKTTQEALAVNIYDRDAVVYKMHGDVCSPDKAVLTRDDYEMYGQDRPLFRTALQGELINKTFLFIGFSFDDPNLNYVLSQIRVLLDTNSREHYCFFKKVSRTEYDCEESYHYDVAKRRLRIEDLRRYGIQAVEVDEYATITKLLEEIERDYLLNNIFISGSFSQPPADWTKDSIESLSFGLAKELVSRDYRIVSGFGLGIGSAVINGALSEIMASKYKHIDEHLCMRPFPQNISDEIERKTLWRQYREEMIGQSGIAIFLFGNKEVDGKLVVAAGMLEEFSIAKQQGKIIIPIGSTGGATAQIYDEVKKEATSYPYLTAYWELLGKETDVNNLIDLVIKIINTQRKTAN